VLTGLALIVILSVLARLFGGWSNIPVIVPLLAAGVLVGESVAGIIDPKDVVFFLSLMGFTLFLNVVALER
jgi:Kef-type K+ transport system membrane component KefB